MDGKGGKYDITSTVIAADHDSCFSSNQKIKEELKMVKRALKYALTISEDPTEIKKNMEEYLAAAGYDRRFRFKWRAISGNSEHIFSGIFEFAGQRYYFNKTLGKLELERI